MSDPSLVASAVADSSQNNSSKKRRTRRSGLAARRHRDGEEGEEEDQEQEMQHEQKHQEEQEEEEQKDQYQDYQQYQDQHKVENVPVPSNQAKSQKQQQQQQYKSKHQQRQQEEEEQEEQEEAAPTPVANQNFKIKKIDCEKALSQSTSDYTQLEINPLLVRSLSEKFEFKSLTPIQQVTIPLALAGRDVLAQARTGSGKTIAFGLPLIHTLSAARFRHANGTGGVVIAPTRELAQQIEGVFLKLLHFFNGGITLLCCIGGINRKQEGYKLEQGAGMIVVATPGRLLDHLKLTSKWHVKNLLVLAVDEADRILDNGFEQEITEIISILPKTRQTLLFSATQTTRVEQLARVSLRAQSGVEAGAKPPVFVSLRGEKEEATVDTLEQGYVVVPSELRFLLLYKFLKSAAKGKKVIVFFSSRASVQFHYELFNYVDLACVCFHGKQKQQQRSATFMQFANASNNNNNNSSAASSSVSSSAGGSGSAAILLTTDVASRGLDIPNVDYIVQYDPPDDPVRYIHRVGRTARAGKCGNALMFLLPSEKKFLSYLREDAQVSVSEYIFDLKKITEQQQEQFQNLVMSNYYLRSAAKTAFEGYLLSYSASQLKNVFDVQSLDLARVARGFGLSEPPHVRLDLSESAARLNKRERRDFKSNQQQQNQQNQNQHKQRSGSANNNNNNSNNNNFNQAGGRKQWVR